MQHEARTIAPASSRVPLSLYIHFPWCVRKCPYCDFNSHALRGEIPEQDYVDALIRDLDWELASPVSGLHSSTDQRPLISVFLGGGTPSLFSGRAIGRVLDAVAARLPLAAGVEITLEANPGAVDETHFRDYRAAGVNRLSIGVQSLNTAHLRALGRIHGPGDALRAVRVARAAGFDNLNLDLMYALPQQTVAQAAADLQALLALEPEHVSYYQLTLEPNTEFAARPPPLPDADGAGDMHAQGLDLLAAAGYAQYEVSAHARRGRESVHNLNYWTFGDYLGIGAGAHGKLTQSVPSPWVERRARHKHPRSYMQGAGTPSAVQERRTVTAPELLFEYALNSLRLRRGFALADFEARTGLTRDALDAPLARAVRTGLVETGDGSVRASARGYLHLNTLLEAFLP